MAEDDIGAGGKALVQAAYQRARSEGWEAPVDFDIVEYTNDTINELFRLIEWASALSAIAPTRGDRRQAKRLMWYLRNTLRDLKQDPATVSAAMDRGATGTQGSLLELEAAIGDCVCRRRSQMALGAIALTTQRRSVLVVGAMDRLEASLANVGVTPVGRAGERGGRWRAGYGRGVRGDSTAGAEPVTSAAPKPRARRQVASDGWEE